MCSYHAVTLPFFCLKVSPDTLSFLRSSTAIRWLIGSYCALAAVAISGGEYSGSLKLILDTVNKIGRYSAAAHLPPLLWRRGRQALEGLEVTGAFLGVRPNEPYAENELSFEI